MRIQASAGHVGGLTATLSEHSRIHGLAGRWTFPDCHRWPRVLENIAGFPRLFYAQLGLRRVGQVVSSRHTPEYETLGKGPLCRDRLTTLIQPHGTQPMAYYEHKTITRFTQHLVGDPAADDPTVSLGGAEECGGLNGLDGWRIIHVIDGPIRTTFVMERKIRRGR